MAYNGYGYANYQQPNARGQSQTPYASSAQDPKPAERPLQNNRQEYAQRDTNWSGQNISRVQGSNSQGARNNYWVAPTNNAVNQSMGYQQQASYRTSDIDQTTNSARQYNSQPQSQHHTSAQGSNSYRVESTSNTGIRQNAVAPSTHYATGTSQAPAGVLPTTASQAYQSRTALHQPDSTQNSRTAAATAMTALSSASRHNYNQNMTASTSNTYQISNSTQYSTPDPGSARSQVGANTASSSNTLYPYHSGNSDQSREVGRMSSSTDMRQRGDTSDMSMPSASSAEPSPQLQYRAHQTQVAAASRSPSLPHQIRRAQVPAPQTCPGKRPTPNDTRQALALGHNTHHPQQHTETTSAAAASTAQTSLPRFVDPTSIYNPYYMQVGVSEGAATAKAIVEQNPATVSDQTEAAQTVIRQDSTGPSAPSQSPEPSVTAPEESTQATAVSTTHTNAPEKPKRKKPPKEVSKDTPKKVRKRASRKRKSDATSTPKPTIAEPQASSATNGGAKENEDTASQMQRMLDEMRMKDPNLFRSLLAANMNKAENSEPERTPSNGTSNARAEGLPNVANTASPSTLPQPPTSSASTGRTPLAKSPSKRTPAKRTPVKATAARSTPIQQASIENPTPVQRPLEATSVVGRPDTPVDTGTDSPHTAKPGIIDGLPDLGKFPALRRKRKLKTGTSFVADGLNQGTVTTFHVNDPGYIEDQASQSTPNPQPVSNVPQHYASLSVEEQRLSLLDNFTKTGRAEIPPTPAIPTPATESIPPNQVVNINNAPAAHPPLQPPTEGTNGNRKAVSFWPNHKRRVLAESACEYIATYPGNKVITPDFVSSLIEQNPSYIQLCHMLEQHGYTINKVHFAKHLLQAFPDLGESSGKTKVETQPTSQPPQPILPVSSFVSPTPSPAALPQSSQNGVSPQVATDSKPVPPLSREEQRQKSLNLLHLSRRTKSASQRRISISASPAPQPREPLPNSKESMARKRTFAEIVDLSALSDEEDDDDEVEEVVDQQNHDEVTIEDPMDTSPDGPIESVAETTMSMQPSAMESPPLPESRSRSATQPVQTSPGMPRDPSLIPEPAPEKAADLANFQYTETSYASRKEELRRYAGIVKPMDKAKALKRSYYDPRTIARDILIAAGRHPTERPLNQHLLKLKEKFQHMDYSSDLETFRWDLVDPGGPPPPKTAPVPIITQPKFESREMLQTSRDPASSQQLPGAANATAHPLPQHHNPTVEADAPSNPMAPTHTSPSFASSLPTRPGPRRAGRPPGAKNKPKLVPHTTRNIEVAIPTATPRKSSGTYQIYECRFDGCGARLHNFDIFRKHVLKLHGRPDEIPAVCMWAGCASLGKGGQVEQGRFSAKELREHLDRVHLSQLAWKLGDGPKPISSGETGKFNQPIVIS
ncbi:uncharacterized protein GIQ15_00323 [Arthroderma uncinatum]|uniref:uncharacterized protein n=1 Tax=Arthroderma uncinatum TaxID=74035 RepID=UPI00144AE437|nr:uncharacterized protein GIQ15_00323 [Arthroderma uncinatum]KAF3490806.1 hypothetical protein GIQ15_00323 [Arthroderma uncinatum]